MLCVIANGLKWSLAQLQHLITTQPSLPPSASLLECSFLLLVPVKCLGMVYLSLVAWNRKKSSRGWKNFLETGKL